MFDWLFSLTDPSLDWNYALITLIVRFIGVFVVMLVMQIALQVAAAVIRRIEARGAEEPPPQPELGGSLDLGLADASTPDDATIAAIGMALALEATAPPRINISRGASPWAQTGRMAQMHEVLGR